MTETAGHVFIRPLGNPQHEARCQRCGWAYSTFESKPVGCPGQRQFDPGVDPGLPEPAPDKFAPFPDADLTAYQAHLDDDLAGLTDAERIGVAVAAMVEAVERGREAARDLAARLEGQLAKAVALLTDALPDLTNSTWAADTAKAESIQAFLEAVGSPETPDEPTEDH